MMNSGQKTAIKKPSPKPLSPKQSSKQSPAAKDR